MGYRAVHLFQQPAPDGNHRGLIDVVLAEPAIVDPEKSRVEAATQADDSAPGVPGEDPVEFGIGVQGARNRPHRPSQSALSTGPAWMAQGCCAVRLFCDSVQNRNEHCKKEPCRGLPPKSDSRLLPRIILVHLFLEIPRWRSITVWSIRMRHAFLKSICGWNSDFAGRHGNPAGFRLHFRAFPEGNSY